MALAPACLLVPARSVEPPHSSALSSASACSAAGAYPQIKRLPSHRSSFSVSASVLEGHNNNNNHRLYTQTRREQLCEPPDEAALLDNLQNPHAQDTFGHRSRDFNRGRRSAPRFDRVDGNGGPKAWEPDSSPPWKKGELKASYNKPPRSQGNWNASSRASRAEDGTSATYRGRTMADRKSRRFVLKTGDMEHNGYARRGSTHSDSSSISWQRQGDSFRQGPSRFDGLRQRNLSNTCFPRERGVHQEKRGNYNNSWGSRSGSREEFEHPVQTTAERNSRFGLEARDMESSGYIGQGNLYSGNESTSWQRQGEYFGHIASRVDTLRQGSPSDTISPWERGDYQQKRGNLNNLWSSSTGSQEEFEQHSDKHGMHSGSRSLPPSGVWEFRSRAQSPYSMQSNVSKGRWQEGQVQKQDDELVESCKEAKLLEDAEQENSPFSNSSPISRMMQRLRSVEDQVPQMHTIEGLQPRNKSADDLVLPSARVYLEDRKYLNSSAEQSEKGVADTRSPWEGKDAVDKEVARARKLRPLSPAELVIPGPELRRLRILAVHLKQRVKIGKHGVTRDVVDSIRQRFQTCEVVKVKCEGPPAGNMKKTVETLEEKTGGLIIWKAGSVVVLYRGQDYGQPVSEVVDDLLAKKYRSLTSHASLKQAANEVGFLQEGTKDDIDGPQDATEEVKSGASLDDATVYLVSDRFEGEEDAGKQFNSGASLDDGSEHLVSDATLGNASKGAASRKKTGALGTEFDTLEDYIMEVEDILKDLGPRFEEWTGRKPLPVDADLLPSSIPNYCPPYRLLPFGRRPNISNTTATHLRRLARPLAPHFVIGRDRGLQGLAAAMVKLWEKSEIAKIGVKRGVLNTSHERIAEDLKQLTGGFFLCRDKYSMTFYRGKDFLPLNISTALANRQTSAEDLQVEEERGRDESSVNIIRSGENSQSLPSWVQIIDPEEQIRLRKEAARARRVQVIAHMQRKLDMALQKKEKAGRELDKVEKLLNPVAPSDDKEILTDEERFMLRKVGLKMKAFLLLGRRGVFSGVVQNMHLHWKHRELVKIVVKERNPVQLNMTATMLEAESGGTLISVDPTSKGFAIVVYRGKNYTRPPELRPRNLLTKRLALQRSLEIQRRESLSRHMQELEEDIAHLRAGLNKMKMLENSGDSVLGEEYNNAQNALEHADFHESKQNQVGILSPSESQGLSEDFVQGGLFEDREVPTTSKLSRRKLKSLCEIGPIFKAARLSKTERNVFRNEVLKMGKAPHFLVGRSNPMSAIAKEIRFHFLIHAFVKIGVSYRPRGTSVQDVVEELEDLTGGTAYAQDDFRVILYRGWPSGEDMPLVGLYDVLSPEQCDILEDECDDEEETMMENISIQAAEKTCVHKEIDEEEGDEDEDEDEGVLQWNSSSDEEGDDDVGDDEEGDHDVTDDEKGDDELRLEITSARTSKTSYDEELHEGLYWNKFSNGHAKNDNHYYHHDSQWTKSLDGHTGDAGDWCKLARGNAVQDDVHSNKRADWRHKRMENALESSHISADFSFEEVEADYGISMAGTRIRVGAGAMDLGVNVDEDVEGFPNEENGNLAGFESIKVDCDSFLAGFGDGEMGFDLDLDEDV